MADKQTQRKERDRRLQLLADYRAWHEAFMHQHNAAIARTRLLQLRRRETNWNWLAL